MTRSEVYARYRQLVDDELPRRAREGRWVVTADHCFGRILLDHAVGGRWYDVLDRRRSPASAQLDDDQLAAAVALGERHGGGQLVVVELPGGRGAAPVQDVVPAPSDGVVEQDPPEAVVGGDHPPAGPRPPGQLVVHQLPVARVELVPRHGASSRGSDVPIGSRTTRSAKTS